MRPRLYASSAERQAAYRERRRQEEPQAIVLQPADREKLAELLHQINAGWWTPNYRALYPRIYTQQLEGLLHHPSYQAKYDRNERPPESRVAVVSDFEAEGMDARYYARQKEEAKRNATNVTNKPDVKTGVKTRKRNTVQVTKPEPAASLTPAQRQIVGALKMPRAVADYDYYEKKWTLGHARAPVKLSDLETLEQAGLLTSSGEGRARIYTLAAEQVGGDGQAGAVEHRPRQANQGNKVTATTVTTPTKKRKSAKN